MSALAERLDLRLQQLAPQRATQLESIIMGILDLIEPEAPTNVDGTTEANKRDHALAALNRIAARGGLARSGDAMV